MNLTRKLKIVIKPGESPSYQYHFKRVRSGWLSRALDTIDGEEYEVTVGDVIHGKKEQNIKSQVLEKLIWCLLKFNLGNILVKMTS